MHKHLSTALLPLALLAACGGSPKSADAPMHGGGDMDMMHMKMGMAAPSADAQAVIAKAKDYATWPTFPELATPKASKAHMGMFVVAYHNDVVGAAMASHTTPLPDGALIVKAQRMKPDADPQSITIMSKQGGKWFWVEATPDGQVVTMNDMPLAGPDVMMCMNCHKDAAANDFVFTHAFAR